MPESESCKSCKFWGGEAPSDFPNLGSCRVEAPSLGKPKLINEGAMLVRLGAWPWVKDEDWCGLWKKA